MARISVYIPDGMKERMSALDDRVNWSEIAQAAFERQLTIASLPKDPNMHQVVERLRASKAEFLKQENDQGREQGRDWAKRRASYDQLRRIAEIELSGEHFALQFDRAFDPNFDGNPQDSFWFEPDEAWPPSDEYVEAFVEGAKDVWDEVADEL